MKSPVVKSPPEKTFADITEAAAVFGTGRSLGALATDYDEDGDTDLFVANDVGFNDMFRNDGDMLFTNVALESGLSCDADGRFQACMGVAGGDYDSDGDIDINAGATRLELGKVVRIQADV